MKTYKPDIHLPKLIRTHEDFESEIQPGMMFYEFDHSLSYIPKRFIQFAKYKDVYQLDTPLNKDEADYDVVIFQINGMNDYQFFDYMFFENDFFVVLDEETANMTEDYLQELYSSDTLQQIKDLMFVGVLKHESSV